MLKWFRRLFRKSGFKIPITYEPAEMEAIDRHIDAYFGKCENVLHEIISTDIHLDIFVIEPTEERNHYTLITCGMGARKMHVPRSSRKLARAELVLMLPPDWDIRSADPKWYWPIYMLKILARLPFMTKSWLGMGHTVQLPDDIRESSPFGGVFLAPIPIDDEGCAECTLPGGRNVMFYQVIPIYDDEMEYKLKHDGLALVNRMLEKSDSFMESCYVVDINRPSALAPEPSREGET